MSRRVVKIMKSRNTAHSYSISFGMKLSVSQTLTRSFIKLLGMNPCHEHNLFLGIKCLLKAESTLKMNDEVDGQQHHGQTKTKAE